MLRIINYFAHQQISMIHKIEGVRRSSIPEAKFSIIIPTWNNLSYLQLCVSSIQKNSTWPHQIIVHINEGSDGTLEWVKSQPDIDYAYSRENIGICYALNYCRHLMSTDYLVYFNDDMYACPDWDKVLYEEVEAIGHTMFFLSGTAIEPATENACYIRGDYGTSLESFQEEALLKDYAAFQARDWQGATWPPNIVHRETWDLIGGYSVEFSPGMYSDPDFSMKLWKLGVRLFKGVSHSRVYHFGSKSTRRVKRNNGYYAFINKWRMTPSTFTRFFLRQGQTFDGKLTEPTLSTNIRIKNFLNRIVSSFKKPVL